MNPELEQVEQFVLRDGRFAPAGVFGDGAIASQAIRGFAIPVRAISDAQANLRTLGQITRS